MRNIAKQAIAHHALWLFDLGLPEMAKLLAVAHERFRKKNF